MCGFKIESQKILSFITVTSSAPLSFIFKTKTSDPWIFTYKIYLFIVLKTPLIYEMANRKKNPRERFLYLRELVTEFQDTSSVDAKEQVLANLANFCYDPDNYTHIKELNVVDLFLDHLQDDNKNVVEFAIGGICNLALDKNFKQLIYKHGGVNKIIRCLSSEREDTVLSAITALMFLVCPESKADITNASVIDCMLRFQESNNRRFSNLASVFLQDYCTPGQIQNARQLSANYIQYSASET